MVGAELVAEGVEELEALGGTLGHGDRHGAVQLHHGRWGQLFEARVEEGDLAPVRLLLGVEPCDRGLELVRPGPAEPDRAVEDAPALGDPLAAPERPVLIVEEDERLPPRRRAPAGARRGGA